MTRTRLCAAALLAAPLLAACGGSKPPPPPRVPPAAATSIVVVAERGASPLDRATAHLAARPLVTAAADGVRPAAARSWTHSADFRQWSFDVDRAADWAAAWPGPGEATAPAPATLAVRLDAPDPDLPARVCGAAPVPNGSYSAPTRLGADWRLFTPVTPGLPPLHFASSDDSRQAVDAFRAGRLARVDFIPADRATAVRTNLAFRSIEAAWTIVLIVDLADPAQRAALAALVDPADLCRKALFDPPRAATRIVPALLGLAAPPPLHPQRASTCPPTVTLTAEPRSAEAALFLPALRSALRQAGVEATEPAPGHPARLRVVALSAETPALDDFFSPLRPLAADHPEIEPLLDSLCAALDSSERADWARALEAALLDSRLVVPIARGAIYSIARPDCGVELDGWGRYVPLAPAGR